MDNPFHSFIDYLATEPVRVSAVLRLPLIASDRRAGVDMGGRPLAARAVRGDPRCVRGRGGAVADRRVPRARSPVGGLGVDDRRPAGDRGAVPGVGRCDVGAAAGVLPAADLGGVRRPAGADRDFRNRHGGGLSRRLDLLLEARRQNRPARTSCTRISASCCGWPSRRPRCASCWPDGRCASGHYRKCVDSWCPRRCRPTSGATAKSPSTCTTARCRRCSPRGWNSTKPASGTPIPRWTWSTRHCRKPRPACVPTVTQLHPQVLAQLGLTPALREMLKQFESRARHRCRCRPRGSR